MSCNEVDIVRGKKDDYIACGLVTEVPEIVALQRRAVASDGSAFQNIE